MSIQVLVATMDQQDHSLPEKMNIQSDAIIANQCDRNEVEEFEYKNHKIKYLSFAERGVGLNRNNALMRANSEICIIADDDLIYVDGYSDIIQKYFNKHPDVDVVIFNIKESVPKRFVIKEEFRVGYFNFMRFGAVRLAFRRKSITKNGITFNLHFGGGAEYSAGEDVLFVHDCLNKGLKIVAIPEFIATLTDERTSTWFTGYNEKYFMDRGVLFFSISKRWSGLLCLQFCIRHQKTFEKEKSWFQAFQLMLKGINKIKNER